MERAERDDREDEEYLGAEDQWHARRSQARRGRQGNEARRGKIQQEIDRRSVPARQQHDGDRADHIGPHSSGRGTERDDRRGPQRDDCDRGEGERRRHGVRKDIPTDHVHEQAKRIEEQRPRSEQDEERGARRQSEARSHPSLADDEVDLHEGEWEKGRLLGEDRKSREEAGRSGAAPGRSCRDHRGGGEQDREVVGSVGACPELHWVRREVRHPESKCAQRRRARARCDHDGRGDRCGECGDPQPDERAQALPGRHREVRDRGNDRGDERARRWLPVWIRAASDQRSGVRDRSIAVERQGAGPYEGGPTPKRRKRHGRRDDQQQRPGKAGSAAVCRGRGVRFVVRRRFIADTGADEKSPVSATSRQRAVGYAQTGESDRAWTSRSETMRITKNTIETTPGPPEWFTGAAYIDAIATPTGPSRLSANSVLPDCAGTPSA